MPVFVSVTAFPCCLFFSFIFSPFLSLHLSFSHFLPDTLQALTSRALLVPCISPRGLVHQWMDHYRVAVGIKSRAVVERRTLTHSAKSLPGAMPSKRGDKRTMYQYRAPSAPPQPRSLMKGADTAETGRPHSSMDRQRPETEGASLRLEVPQDTRSQYLLQEERAQAMLARCVPLDFCLK